MSALEDELAMQMRLVGLPEPEREFRFAPPRRWQFDFAFVSHKVAVEVEGQGPGGYGRHQSPDGFRRDAEKYGEAVVLGWRVLRVTDGMIRDGRAVALLERVLRKES